MVILSHRWILWPGYTVGMSPFCRPRPPYDQWKFFAAKIAQGGLESGCSPGQCQLVQVAMAGGEATTPCFMQMGCRNQARGFTCCTWILCSLCAWSGNDMPAPPWPLGWRARANQVVSIRSLAVKGLIFFPWFKQAATRCKPGAAQVQSRCSRHVPPTLRCEHL